jgi:hypothetical protein
MYLKISYKTKTKRIPFKPDLLKCENLEQKAKEIFKLQGQQLLLYYLDEDNVKIAIVQDADVETMVRSNFNRKNCLITVETNKEVLFGSKNLEVLKRRYLHQLNRKFYGQKAENYREFKNDLANIHNYLQSCGLEQEAVQEIVQFLNRNTGLELMDQMLVQDLDSAKEYPLDEVPDGSNFIDIMSVSSINRPDHSSRFSFMSRTDGVGVLLEQGNSQSSDHHTNQSQADQVEQMNEIVDGNFEEELDQELPDSVLDKLRGSNGYRYCKQKAMKRSLMLQKNNMESVQTIASVKKPFIFGKLSKIYNNVKDKFFKK